MGTPEWVGAATSVATLIVVAITAYAALRQMRHLRAGNQVSLFTAYNTEWDSDAFSRAFAFVRKLRCEELDDRTLFEIAETGTLEGELHSIRLVANFFEDMGAFVMTGILPKEIVCNLYSANVDDAWTALAPFVALYRERRQNVAIWENFEYLAYLSREFIAEHPEGTYPKTIPRLDADDSLVRRWKQLRTGGRISAKEEAPVELSRSLEGPSLNA